MCPAKRIRRTPPYAINLMDLAGFPIRRRGSSINFACYFVHWTFVLHTEYAISLSTREVCIVYNGKAYTQYSTRIAWIYDAIIV